MIQKLKDALRSTLIYGLGNLSIKLVGLVLLPLYTKYLPVADYGALALLESLSQILIVACSLNITSALFRWYWDSRFKDRQKSMFFTVLIFSTVLGAAMVALVAPFAPVFSTIVFGTLNWSHVLLLMTGFAATEIVISIPAALIRLQERPGLYTSVMVARVLTNLVATVVLILFVSASVDSIYIAQLIGGGVYLMLIFPYILRNIKARFEGALLWEMVMYSFPLVLNSISMILVSFADRYMLKLFGALTDVGIYSLGFKIANIVLFVVMSVQLAIGPMVYKAFDEPGNRRFFAKILTYMSLAIMWLVLAVSVFGIEIVKLLARNPAYWPAAVVIPVVAFSIFFSMARDNVTTGLIATRNTKRLFLINAAMAVVNIVFDIIMIPRIGIMGAAWAGVLTQVLAFMIYYRFAQAEYFIPYELRKVGTVVVAGAALYVIAPAVGGLELIFRIPLKLVLLCSFPFLLFVLRFYDDIELIRLREAFNKWKRIDQWKVFLQGP